MHAQTPAQKWKHTQRNKYSTKSGQHTCEVTESEVGTIIAEWCPKLFEAPLHQVSVVSSPQYAAYFAADVLQASVVGYLTAAS